MITDEQVSILRHMLGVNDPSSNSLLPSRNYYCTNPGDAQLEEMATLNLVKRYSERDGYWWYSATELGKQVALESARRYQLSVKKRMYRTYLDLRDVFCDLSFREFLISPKFADSRERVKGGR